MAAAAGHEEQQRVREAAGNALRGAYAPYSNYPVGAAALLDNGLLISGANVENASYGLTLCAEAGMVAKLPAQRTTDGVPLPRLRTVAVVNADRELIMPCGRCRQLLAEFADERTVVLSKDGPVSLAALLPMAFGPRDLAGTRNQSTEPRQAKENS